MNLLIFGTGDYYNRYKKWFNAADIVALVDNAQEKVGTLIDGHKVISPNEIAFFSYDYIVILSFAYASMKKQLLELNVAEDKILHFYTLRKIIDWRKQPKDLVQYGDISNKRIALLSQELNNGGPALALFNMAQVLKNNHFDICVISMIDGELRNRFLEEDIPVVIDYNLQLATMDEVSWKNDFDLIICNTLNFHIFLTERDTNTPVSWWLHDSIYYYDGVERNKISKLLLQNLKCYSVGDMPKRALRDFLPSVEIRDLLYSVQDSKNEYKRTQANIKLKFVIIGFLMNLKGQDILVDSIKKYYRDFKDKIEIDIVGVCDTLYGKQLMDECAAYSEINFRGVLSRSEIHQTLCDVDVLICPSREDSMPTVVTEAMMHSTPCIVSSAIGTCKYLTNGVDSLIFEKENIDDLASKMKWCINNKERLIDMGKAARMVYEKYFSEKVFETNVLTIVKENLKE